MRDVTTMNADVTEQKSARFATIHTRQALSWGSPTVYSCAEPLFSTPQCVGHQPATNRSFRRHSFVVRSDAGHPRTVWGEEQSTRCPTHYTPLTYRSLYTLGMLENDDVSIQRKRHRQIKLNLFMTQGPG